ncbi:MAG TPA: hypothetical protein VHL34_23465 [Rhizomicrobium sp.]|nr:hypothetical protein [Rhizomicrobium sp.]
MFSYWTILIVAALGVVAYIYKQRVVDSVRAFDRRNVERIEQEQEDRRDSLAHFRHTASIAEEQVEDVIEIDAIDERLGTPVKRYVFEGETFGTRFEANAARQRKIVEMAREYYRELPAALAARGKDRLN